MLVDLHVHGMAHGAFSHTQEEIRNFINYAEERGIGILGFAEHDWFLDKIDFQMLRSMQSSTWVALRVGLEVDHRPGLMDAKGLDKYPFDYLIGSVHEIDGFLFDHPDHIEIYREWDSDSLYYAYFEVLEDLIMSGAYDIIGHFDLIKLFGCRPTRSITGPITDLLEAVKKRDLVVEVNTAGKYKPVGEIYPGPDILRLFRELGVPITLGSDAHEPSHVGRDLAEQAGILAEMGFKEVVTFRGREPEFHSII